MYINKTTFAGMDWHDICTDRSQVTLDNNPLIYDVESVIYAEIKNLLMAFDVEETNEIFSYQDFLDLKSKSYSWDSEDSNMIILITYDSNENTYKVKIDDQFSYTGYYHVYDAKNPVYLPVVQYFYGIKYGDTLVRFFCEDYFTNYQDAVKFMEQEKANRNPVYAIDQYDDYQIYVYDKDDLEKQQWYLMNKAVNQKVKTMDKDTYKKIANQRLTEDCERFSISENFVISKD